MRPMPWWTWVALAFFLVVGVGVCDRGRGALARHVPGGSRRSGGAAHGSRAARRRRGALAARARAAARARRGGSSGASRTSSARPSSSASSGGRLGDSLDATPRLRQAVLGKTRVAVVDLGTNSTRLLVADVEGDDGHEVERRLDRHAARRGGRPTAAAPADGHGPRQERARRLPPDRGGARCRADARIATSAVRDAENGEAFLGEIEWSYGFATRLLTGEEEAERPSGGVAAGRSIPAGTVVVDVGGGSTELIAGGPEESSTRRASTSGASG